VLSWRQASLYRDSETIWLDTLRKNPTAWVAHYNLGVEYQSRGDAQSAVDHYFQAIALKPDHARAEYNLGVALSELGRKEEAIAHYRQAIAIRPDYPRALSELGAALGASGLREEAITVLAKAIRLQPVYPDAHYRLGSILLELGAAREREAEAELRIAVQQDPGLARAWMRLGSLYQAQGRVAEAAECFARGREAAGGRR
jgi:tetratricopeptide (TPR) repeat protein